MRHPPSRPARPASLVALAVIVSITPACGDSGPTGSNTPPVAEITTPATDTGTDNLNFTYDGYDETRSLWYKDVLLEGTGADAEDGTLRGTALTWTTDRSDLQDAGLGSGNALTVRLYSDQCTGSWHDITLTATDSDDASGTARRRIFLWTLC
jgi:hypothetical protein